MATDLYMPEHRADAVRMVIKDRLSVAKVVKSLGRLKLTGRLCPDADGPHAFQRVEGELNAGTARRVAVAWRKLTDDAEKDAAVLDAWMARHDGITRERTERRDYHSINRPVKLPRPTAEIRTLHPTEDTFKIKMFQGTVGGGL